MTTTITDPDPDNKIFLKYLSFITSIFFLFLYKNQFSFNIL